MHSFGPKHSGSQISCRPASRWVLILGLLCAGAASFVGCAPAGPARRAGAGSGEGALPVVIGQNKLDVERLYVAQGRRAVIPLVPPDGTPAETVARWRPGRPPRVVLESGAELAPRVYKVRARPPSDPLAGMRWLPPHVEWESELLTSFSESQGDDASGVPAVFVAVVDVPTGIPERRLPRFVRVDDRVLDLVWLPPVPQNPDVARVARPQSSPQCVAALGAMLAEEAGDPMRCWRVRLVAPRFGEDSLWPQGVPSAVLPQGASGIEPAENEPLRVAADQLDLNVRAAIDALRRQDRDLALAVLSRLTAVVRSPDGTLLPAWPVGDLGVEPLIRSLLDPGATGASKAEAAKAWLEASRPMNAWITDDIGAPLGGGADAEHAASPRFEPTVGIADFTGSTPEVARLTSNVGFRAEALRSPISEFQCISLRAPVSLNEPERPVLSASLRGAMIELQPIAGRLPVRPPGVTIGPLLCPWTLTSWLARTTSPTPDAWQASVLIQRRAGGGGWELAVTARRPTGENGPGPLRVWCGPFQAPRCRIVINGADAHVFRGMSDRPETVEARVGRTDSDETVLVTLPPEALEPDGATLIVGIDRDLGEGLVGSFPRPMLPGQPEPGRLALDLSAWGALKGE